KLTRSEISFLLNDLPVAPGYEERSREVQRVVPFPTALDQGAGTQLSFLCVPLVLGSWLALLPGAANAVLMVIRARQEDRMLRAELGGYEAYAHRVRYRLLP